MNFIKTIGFFTLLTTMTVQASMLSHSATKAQRIATKLNDTVLDYEDGYASKREVVAEIRNLETVLERMKSHLRPVVRPHPPRPIPGPRPLPPVRTNITANCKVDIGGNFFEPKSYVDCEIQGRGATSYEIRVNGRVKWRGALSPRNTFQEFKTGKEKVGGHGASYTVLVTDIRGNKLVVFSQ